MKDFFSQHKYRVWWAAMLLVGVLYSIFYLLPGLQQLGGRWAQLGKDNSTTIVVGFWVGWLLLTALIWWAIVRSKFTTSVGDKLNKLKFNWDLLAIFLCLILFIGGVVLANKRHLDIRTGLFDFALEHQVVWNTAEGRPFAASVEVSNYLGDHFSLITLPVSVIYRAFPSTLTLFSLQAGSLALAAFGIYLLAKKVLKSGKWAAGVLLLFSIYWGIYGLVMFDYHPVVFALPLLVFGLYFTVYGTEKQQWLGYGLLIMATFAKEDIGIFVGSLGLYLTLVKKDKRGFGLAIYSYAIAVAALAIIIPAFRGEASDTLARYVHVGMPLGEILSILFNQQHLTYLVRLFAPVFFLPLLAPRVLLTIIPSLVINYLADYEGQLSLINHYDVVTTLGVFGALIVALKLLRNQKDFKLLKLIVAGILFINLAILPGHPVVRDFRAYPDRRAVYEQLADFRPLIPEDKILMATNRIGAHFGERQQLQVLDPSYRRYAQLPDYILVDTMDGKSAAHVQDELEKLLIEGNFKLIKFSDKLKLFGR